MSTTCPQVFPNVAHSYSQRELGTWPTLRPEDEEAAVSEDVYGQNPPQDLEAEQSVLGAMLMSKDAIADVVEVVRGGDFYLSLIHI